MPSQVRRVRTHLLGLPEGAPAALDDGLHSLPLPESTQRPPLLPLLRGDSTKSLPLPPAGGSARRTPLYRVQRAMSAASGAQEQQGGGQQAQQAQAQQPQPSPLATPTSTLTPAARARLGQQLWQRLQMGRLLHRTSCLLYTSRRG